MLGDGSGDFECLVIGAGLAGLTSAIQLSLRGFKVALIYDAGDELYATKATHGISTIKGILESDAELFGWKLEGHRGFFEWLSMLEGMLSIKRPAQVWLSGVLESFQSFQDFKKEFGRIYRHDFIGAKRVEWSEPDDTIFAQVRYPGDWWINPRYLLDLYWKAVAHLNVTALKGRVRNILLSPNLGQASIVGQGVATAKVIVISCGSGTPELLASSNLSVSETFFAVGGHSFSAVADHRRSYCVVKGTSGISQVGHEIFWGSTSESPLQLRGGRDELTQIDRNMALEEELARSHLSRLLPGQQSMKFSGLRSHWGLRIRARTRAPLVRRILQEGDSSVWINTGYYKSGIILSWMLAGQMAKTIDAERPCFSSH